MVLRASLARQVKNGTIPANVADGIEKPSARTRKAFTIWTEEEAGRFLAVAEVDRLAPFWFLALIEGMRRGEALGLRWRDLHWSDDETSCVAQISQTVVPDLAHGGRALIQERAKTRSSQRPVMLTAPTIAVLKSHRDRQRFERQALADVWSADDLIVTTTIGSVVNPTTVKRSLNALVEKAGIPSVTTHGLRHMVATVILRAGLSPALVALKLGHSDIGTTVDRYGHLTANDQSAANAAIEAAAARGRVFKTGTGS
jgi:integrase